MDPTTNTPNGSATPPAHTAASAPSLSERLSSLVRPRSRTSQFELIATLNDVADAVSSAMNVGDVLDVIVERTKRITDTDKAVLVLTDEHEPGLDLETIVVRGRRDQHLQEWWETELNEISHRVFQDGQPVLERYTKHDAMLLLSPILVRNEPIGLLCAINTLRRPFTAEQTDFLAILSAFASSAIENARLAEQSRYVLLASERDRIAREMHDGVVQSLFSISLGLEVCKKQVFRDVDGAAERLDELQSHLNTAMGELRRFIYDLRPAKLTELGLVDGIEYWIREITLGRSIRGQLSIDGEPPRMTPAQEACLYRVTKEAVSNVVRHSGSDEFEVRLVFSPELVHLEVADQGSGFDAAEQNGSGVEQIGLRSIRQRVDREGGELRIESTVGEGTNVIVDLPLEGIRS